MNDVPDWLVNVDWSTKQVLLELPDGQTARLELSEAATVASRLNVAVGVLCYMEAQYADAAEDLEPTDG